MILILCRSCKNSWRKRRDHTSSQVYFPVLCVMHGVYKKKHLVIIATSWICKMVMKILHSYAICLISTWLSEQGIAQVISLLYVLHHRTIWLLVSGKCRAMAFTYLGQEIESIHKMIFFFFKLHFNPTAWLRLYRIDS